MLSKMISKLNLKIWLDIEIAQIFISLINDRIRNIALWLCNTTFIITLLAYCYIVTQCVLYCHTICMLLPQTVYDIA